MEPLRWLLRAGSASYGTPTEFNIKTQSVGPLEAGSELDFIRQVFKIWESRKPGLVAQFVERDDLAVLPLKAGDNAAELADCLALESRNNHEVHVTIRPPAITAAVSVKLFGETVAIGRADAVRKAKAVPRRETE